MSTRSTAHFIDNSGATQAIVYRHWDGYPEVAGRDILQFIETVKKNSPGDTRFTDPEYLAARYVAFLGDKFSVTGAMDMGVWHEEKLPPYSFISVGVCMRDPGDIEYRYLINCGLSYDPSGQITEEVGVEFVNIYRNTKHDLREYLATVEATA